MQTGIFNPRCLRYVKLPQPTIHTMSRGFPARRPITKILLCTHAYLLFFYWLLHQLRRWPRALPIQLTASSTKTLVTPMTFWSSRPYSRKTVSPSSRAKSFSSFHVEVTNLFWGLSDHYYGNDGVRRSGGTYIEPVAFSATNTSFAWQASGNQFWSSQERGGAPLYNYFAVTSPGFSDSNTFKYHFDRAVTSVPEPAVFLQLSAGLVMLGAFTRRRRPRNPAPQSI